MQAPTHILALLALAILPACTGTARTENGRPSSSDPATRHGELRSDSLWSPALGVWKAITVYVPPSYASEPRRRYPVAYYLHGMWGSERDWSTQGNIAAIADSLIAEGMPEMIIAMPDGDNGYYTTWATPGDYEGCRREPPIPEAPASYCVPTPRYDEYLARDVVRWVDSTSRTRRGPEHRAVAGLSMGGYGAITLALRYPDVWSAGASHSGVLALMLGGRDSSGAAIATATNETLEERWGQRFWPLIAPVFGRDTSGWWAREPARIAERRAASRARAPALFIDVGTGDRLVVAGNRVFRDELRRLGIPFTYREWPGAHTWGYWRAHVPESLQWIAQRIGS